MNTETETENIAQAKRAKNAIKWKTLVKSMSGQCSNIAKRFPTAQVEETESKY